MLKLPAQVLCSQATTDATDRTKQSYVAENYTNEGIGDIAEGNGDITKGIGDHDTVHFLSGPPPQLCAFLM